MSALYTGYDVLRRRATFQPELGSQRSADCGGRFVSGQPDVRAGWAWPNLCDDMGRLVYCASGPAGARVHGASHAL